MRCSTSGQRNSLLNSLFLREGDETEVRFFNGEGEQYGVEGVHWLSNPESPEGSKKLVCCPSGVACPACLAGSPVTCRLLWPVYHFRTGWVEVLPVDSPVSGAPAGSLAEVLVELLHLKDLAERVVHLRRASWSRWEYETLLDPRLDEKEAAQIKGFRQRLRSGTLELSSARRMTPDEMYSAFPCLAEAVSKHQLFDLGQVAGA